MFFAVGIFHRHCGDQRGSLCSGVPLCDARGREPSVEDGGRRCFRYCSNTSHCPGRTTVYGFNATTVLLCLMFLLIGPMASHAGFKYILHILALALRTPARVPGLEHDHSARTKRCGVRSLLWRNGTRHRVPSSTRTHFEVSRSF